MGLAQHHVSSIDIRPSLSLLLIDDDRELCGMMQQFFTESGHRLDYEMDGTKGLVAATSGTYDLIILDVMLPGIDGFTLLNQLRHRSNVPVLMLTARALSQDRIHGLDLGADDYLLKPFDPDELLARVRAVLRRADQHRSGQLYHFQDIAIDLAKREVRVAGELATLTEMEFQLLEILVRRAGRIVSRDEMALVLFGRAAEPYDRILDVHISNLRKKLGRGRELLQTVRGVGYVFNRTV